NLDTRCLTNSCRAAHSDLWVIAVATASVMDEAVGIFCHSARFYSNDTHSHIEFLVVVDAVGGGRWGGCFHDSLDFTVLASFRLSHHCNLSIQGQQSSGRW
ncbi:unnamed protein product, partial [Polarella glacialis]